MLIVSLPLTAESIEVVHEDAAHEALDGAVNVFHGHALLEHLPKSPECVVEFRGVAGGFCADGEPELAGLLLHLVDARGPVGHERQELGPGLAEELHRHRGP